MKIKMNQIMYISIFLLGIFVLAYYRKAKSEKESVKSVNPNELVQNEIVHEQLSEKQIEKIKKIQSSFADVYKISLEETITNFKRDQNPDAEIEVWLNMLKAYEKFVYKNGTEIELNKKTEVFKLILMRSMMDEKEAEFETKCTILNKNEIKEIFSYYKIEAKPLLIETK
jgi:hypothetical protein